MGSAAPTAGFLSRAGPQATPTSASAHARAHTDGWKQEVWASTVEDAGQRVGLVTRAVLRLLFKAKSWSSAGKSQGKRLRTRDFSPYVCMTP